MIKKKIGIIVGEDADLTDEIIKKNKIVTFAFVIDWDKYTVGQNIYKLMRQEVGGSGPKTSQPQTQAFKSLFENELKNHDELIVITVSSKFSGTYNSALQAKNSISGNKIHLIDSESSSGAEGLLVLKTCELVNSGTQIKKIIEQLNFYRSQISLVGTFESPKWLVAGGRLSKIKGILVEKMRAGGFRPILTIKEGEIVVKKIQMNSRDSVEALVNQFKDEVDINKKYSVVITHADCMKDALRLGKQLEIFSKSVTIEYIHEISPVVGSHLGPDTLLLSWVVN